MSPAMLKSPGADDEGDDMVVGRTNETSKRTLLVAINGDPDGYQTDFVLQVSSQNNQLLKDVQDGVDGIHAVGTEALNTGGAIGTIPEGNGIVGRGLNGVVGYVHAAANDKPQERDVHAGVLGEGGSASPGLFGRGSNGVVGYTSPLARDLAFETAEPAGLVGLAQGVGVRGRGDNGGVKGVGPGPAFGVQGHSDLGPGVYGDSPGGTGVMGQSKVGDGVNGASDQGIGGVFSSQQVAQIRLQPHPVALATPNGTIAGAAGDLIVLQQPHEDVQGVTLWFCHQQGDAATAIWVQIA